MSSIKSTIICRVTDGLPLSASVDEEKVESGLAEYKSQAKLVIRRMNTGSEPRCSIQAGACTLHYLITENVVFLIIVDKAYPRKLAFSYLEEVAQEFIRCYGPETLRVTRPYAFVQFDTFLQKTRRLYEDSRNSGARGNLDKLNEELVETATIMSKSLEDLLWRGDSLDRMSTMSSSLRDESLKYRNKSRDINLQALYRKWAPVAMLASFLLLVLWWRIYT